jgi:hypothetical protein
MRRGNNVGMDYAIKAFWGGLVMDWLLDYGDHFDDDFLTVCTLARIPVEGMEAVMQYLEALDLEDWAQHIPSVGMPS